MRKDVKCRNTVAVTDSSEKKKFMFHLTFLNLQSDLSETEEAKFSSPLVCYPEADRISIQCADP